MKKLNTMHFSNVYFINGTAYAGKSTMVKLLAEKYNGIACEENYHDKLLPELSKEDFPCLTYTRDLTDWHDFIRRTPEEYEAWIDGASFFERPDREKQFLYQLIMEEPDPEQALENYRQGLMRIHSQERYGRFLYSGFHVIHRDEKERPGSLRDWPLSFCSFRSVATTLEHFCNLLQCMYCNVYNKKKEQLLINYIFYEKKLHKK